MLVSSKMAKEMAPVFTLYKMVNNTMANGRTVNSMAKDFNLGHSVQSTVACG